MYLSPEVHSTFDDMSEADFAVLRQTLVNFLQDRRVKVSIFLQESIQASDGSITIAAAGRLAYGINPPGQARAQGRPSDRARDLVLATAALPCLIDLAGSVGAK